VPKALIAPHAGYVYSGPIAGTAYALLAGRTTGVDRVVLLGPAHRVRVQGLAASSAEAFATPLGSVPLDRAAHAELLARRAVQVMDTAHAAEHSLEVHLPFLQRIIPRFSLVPLAVGAATADEVAAVLDSLWGGSETLIVISTDLSHYYDYATARELDAATCTAITALDPSLLDHDSACGRNPVSGLLVVAKRRGLRPYLLDLRNSGDTAGPRDEVVGYASFAFL
jgi:AmmeMemoRadiSam system protein B